MYLTDSSTEVEVEEEHLGHQVQEVQEEEVELDAEAMTPQHQQPAPTIQDPEAGEEDRVLVLQVALACSSAPSSLPRALRGATCGWTRTT